MHKTPENKVIRLAIVCTHPIQYFAPVFEMLAMQAGLEVKVFYGWRGATERSPDPGFGESISWDIPLLEGYEYEFIENVANDPGSHHFWGINLPTLCQCVQEWQPDAVLVYGWCYKAHLQTLRFFKGRLPVFFRGDPTLVGRVPGWRNCLRIRLLKWVYHHVDCALYVGTHNRAYYNENGVADSALVFAPHAVDNIRFESAAAENEAAQWRRELGISMDEKVLLMPAKLEPVKDPAFLLENFVEWAQSDWHLVFAGSGPLEDSLRGNNYSRVHFLGFQNQSKMPSVYHLADLVALPSKSETWGLVINEAMACGCPLLVSDRVGSAVDLVTERNGWIFKSGDSSSLLATLEAVERVGKGGLRERGDQSRVIIKEWTIKRQVDAIFDAVRARVQNE